MLYEKGLNASAKTIDPRQPAKSEQADMGRNLSLSLKFLDIKRTFYVMAESAISQNGFIDP